MVSINVDNGGSKLTLHRDQEMRFNVHDSPDYYQLKVSVFNDDKKTELIGETWVGLDQVIVPGGGQNDLWHNLNCKGRYAGEIRIELTYYDTRQKEEKVTERRQESTLNGLDDREREAVGGPRQPKQVKRRPLPADPTDSSSQRPTMPDHSQSSPFPFTPSRNDQPLPSLPQQSLQHPIDHGPEHTFPPDNRYQYAQQNELRGSPPTYDDFDRKTHEGDLENTASPRQLLPTHYETYDSNGNLYSPDTNLPHNPASRGEIYQDTSPDYGAPQGFRPPPALELYRDSSQNGNLPTLPPFQPRNTRPPAHPLIARDAFGNLYSNQDSSLPQQHSMPDVRQQRQFQSFSSAEYEQSPPRSSTYDGNPLRHRSLDNSNDTRSGPVEASQDEDGPPPPPPVHRSSGLISPTQPGDRNSAENYQQVSAPPPLNIRNARGSISASPLSQVQTNLPRSAYAPSISPTNSHGFSQSGPSMSSHTSYSQLNRQQSQDPTLSSPTKEYGQGMPPSLVPGYDPNIAQDESERLIYENQMGSRQMNSNEAVPTYDRSPVYNEQSRIQQLVPYNEQQTPLRQVNDRDRREPRSSAPMIKPNAVSPNPRTPVRKSVSPQPQPANNGRRLSAIPFSPDSYDAFNPNLSSVSSVNSPGPKYNTPEQAKEASRQHDREAKLEDGPIIGNDGKVIDPSDHLPTDTWAPEPERKTPRKGPEVTLRYKNSPKGAQPMPSPGSRSLRDPAMRPLSVSTPIYSHTPEQISPSSANRNRLQKKSRVSPALPTSSPIVPTIGSGPRAPMPRTSASEYPLREHENYGYGSSPTYARISPAATRPPPVPGKIPLVMGQEEWGANTLSDEMSRIDIGVGGGGGRARRSRFA